MSPNVPGDLLIFAAFAFNLIAGLSFFREARGNAKAAHLGRLSYHLFTIFTTAAVGYLFYLFFSHNYALKYVFEYSCRDQSNFYILAAFWGGQEGTYLLWLFFNAVFGYLLFRWAAQYRAYALTFYSIVNLFFLILLMKLSPFALLDFPAADGLGLNPLLRDPWMVIHPPVIFVGYAMAAIPFVIAMAALVKGDFSGWLKASFPWVAIASLALAAGNVLGGFWAYKTLGWGGYWAWDPVENSSFVPWIISLALLHGLIIERRSNALRKTNILLASFLFLLVVYGTYLTRSGVLSDFSVHSFTDTGINSVLIAFIAVFTAGTLALFFARMNLVSSAPLSYNFYGREFSLFAGLATLTAFGVIVLVWTSLPILTMVVGAEPRAAAVSTYNDFAGPLAVIMALLLTVAPLVSFAEFRPSNQMRMLTLFGSLGILCGAALFAMTDAGLVPSVLLAVVILTAGMYLLKPDLRKALIPALVGFVATAVFCIAAGVTQPLAVLFFATAAMAIISNVIALGSFFPGRWINSGAQLTHFGFGLMLVGILASSAFTTSEKLKLEIGKPGQAYDRSITYNGMANEITHPNNELILNLVEGESSKEIRPQLYYSERMEGIMRRPYVERTLLYDLYLAPEQIQPGESGDSLLLKKGESETVGDLAITFVGFDMGSHGEDNSAMTVAVNLDITQGDKTTRVVPARVHGTGPDGEPWVRMEPGNLILADGTSRQIYIERILADQGAVLITAPGLTQGSSEQLILDISKKPLINLTWGGAILIMLGTLVVFFRRYRENQLPISTGPVAERQLARKSAA